MRGLLFRRSVKSDEGVVLRPSFSIHTAFMQFPIDVVFLDQDLRVLRIADSVRPFRTASCRGSREVVELRAGECERRGLVVGDRVAWASTTPAAPVDVGRPGRPLFDAADAVPRPRRERATPASSSWRGSSSRAEGST